MTKQPTPLVHAAGAPPKNGITAHHAGRARSQFIAFHSVMDLFILNQCMSFPKWCLCLLLGRESGSKDGAAQVANREAEVWSVVTKGGGGCGKVQWLWNITKHWTGNSTERHHTVKETIHRLGRLWLYPLHPTEKAFSIPRYRDFSGHSIIFSFLYHVPWREIYFFSF